MSRGDHRPIIKIIGTAPVAPVTLIRVIINKQRADCHLASFSLACFACLHSGVEDGKQNLQVTLQMN